MHRLEHGPTLAGTQNVWCLFLIYLAFSRFANIKLGAADEQPRYNDFTWFSMLFTCGVAVGLYVFGVAEPLYFYRTPTAGISWSSVPEKTPVDTDAQRAQQAIFMAVYHWGIHGWVPYVLLALLLGVVLLCVDVDKPGAHTIAWLCMTGLLLLVAFARGELRRK